mmetsp:Transcript_12238/g.22646  ORF Transcript_12238/g.22646 Transcript_12238/m.22646 type:complete len:629 (+) Transcript_12238:46-1932(+)
MWAAGAVWLVALGCCYATEQLQFAQVLHAADGRHDLTIGHVPFADYGFDTRGFNGAIPGPTFRVNPGETLKVNFINQLDAANNHNCSGLADESFCETATSNLHTHGLHVSSKGLLDGLSYHSDDIFADVQPGQTAQFEFHIPESHMPGTHWYHPHHHHATALQAGGGAAGVLIVNDPDGYLPSAYSEMEEKVLFLSAHNLGRLQQMARESDSSLLEDAIDSAEEDDLPTNVFLANGQLGPQESLMSHTWYRFRMVYAAVEQSLNLQIVPLEGGATCTMQLLAKDGVYLETMPREISTVYLFPGARSDVAMACTCETYPCTAMLASDANAPGGLRPGGPQGQGQGPQGPGRRLQGGGGPPPRKPPPMGNGGAPPGAPAAEGVTVNITYFVIEETSGGSMYQLPEVTVVRPCYVVDLQAVDVENSNSGNIRLDGGDRRVEFNQQGNSMTYDAVRAVGGKHNWPALATLQVGQVYEFTVTGNGVHPLHIHVNPYQITELPDNNAPQGDGYFQVGDWHDTLLLPGMNGQDSMKIRMQTDVFTGKMVLHCHILEHEDEGMMAWIDVVGTEGSVWANNTDIENTCYRATFNASQVDWSSITTMQSVGLATRGSASIAFMMLALSMLAARPDQWV